MSDLRLVRKRKGDSLEDVAKRIGITPSHLSRIERGSQIPSPVIARRLADYSDREVTEMDLLYPKSFEQGA